MILYAIFNLFIIAPFIEWGIHYGIHRPPPLKYHKNHHLSYFSNKPIYEFWVIPVILFLYYMTWYLASLGFFKYTIVHNIIHYFPNALPSLTRHHLIHHENPKVNFAVSAIFPDKIMGTYSKYFHSEKVVKI